MAGKQLEVEGTLFCHKALLLVLRAQAEKDWNPWGMACHKNPSENVLVVLCQTSLLLALPCSCWGWGGAGWVGEGRECLNSPDDFGY